MEGHLYKKKLSKICSILKMLLDNAVARTFQVDEL